MPLLKRQLDDLRKAGKAKGREKIYGLASGSVNQVS